MPIEINQPPIAPFCNDCDDVLSLRAVHDGDALGGLYLLLTMVSSERFTFSIFISVIVDKGVIQNDTAIRLPACLEFAAFYL
jgi:hypothetical protein